MKNFSQWEGFKGNRWKEKIDVRNFISMNYTPYDGDASFLEEPTEATNKLWGKLQELQKEERAKGGVLDMETEVVTSLTAYGPGYIDEDLKDLETVVGLQTDKPLKRAFMPYGGIKMAEQACETQCRSGQQRRHAPDDAEQRKQKGGYGEEYVHDSIRLEGQRYRACGIIPNPARFFPRDSHCFPFLPVSLHSVLFRPVRFCFALFCLVLSLFRPVLFLFCSGISAASVRLGPNRRFSPQSGRLRREDAGGGGCGGGCIMFRATVFDRTFRAVCPGVASVWRMRACAGVFSRSWMVRCAAIGPFRNLRPRRVCGRCVCRNIGKIFVSLFP